MKRIRVSDNGRYFVGQRGEPFFWLGDTQWELFRLFYVPDAKAVLERRKEQGFSVIQIMFTGVGDGAQPNLAGEPPWIGHDPAHPSEVYFRNVDQVIKAADEVGLILVIGVYHQLQRTRITTGNARAYARWIAERYADAPHLIWTMYPEARQEFVPVLRELAAGLHEGDGGAHLITVHPDPSVTSSSFIHEEDWLAFNMIQTCVDYDRIYEMVSADYARTPAKPTVMAEGGYEGVEFNKTQTALEVRKQAYWSYLAGGHHSYGHNDNWVSPSTWRMWIESEGAEHLSVCRRILTGLQEWWNLVPDQSLLGSGEGSGLTLNVAARSSAGHWAIIYFAGQSSAAVAMRRACAGEPVEAVWVDPTSGKRTRIDCFPGTGTRSFTTPSGWQDALLLLERHTAT